VGGAVAFAVLAAIWGSLAVHEGWDIKRVRMQAVATDLDAAGALATDRVMSIDAAGYRYWTGRGGVVLVNDPLETVEAVARAYDIHWLVLERADTVPAVREILLEGRRPAWVGSPVTNREDVSVYPVCVVSPDPRCAAGASRATGSAAMTPPEPLR